MNDSPSALRPEAGPVPFDSLTLSQREAMKAIAAALKEATAQTAKLQKLKDRDGLVDADRASRLFFVSGEPGIGKSSLYLTLSAILGKEKRYDDIRKEYRKEIQDLSELDGATRWLEQIDLEVAGDTGENLLAAVLVRIFAAIDNSSGIKKHISQPRKSPGDVSRNRRSTRRPSPVEGPSAVKCPPDRSARGRR